MGKLVVRGRPAMIVAASAVWLTACSDGVDPKQLQADNLRLQQEQAQLSAQLDRASQEKTALEAQLAALAADVEALKSKPEPSSASAVLANGAPSDAAAIASPNGTTEPAETAAIAPSQAIGDLKYQPGWVVQAYPMEWDDNSGWIRIDRAPSLAEFVVSPSPLRMNAHRKVLPVDKLVMYEAKGFFLVRDPGEHTFTVGLTGDSSTACDLSLSLEGQSVAAGRQTPGREERIVYGVAKLEPGLYAVAASVTCRANFERYWRESYNNSVRFAVKKPGRPTLEEFGDGDLVHLTAP